MTVLVTGAAGFIGFHVCRALLASGAEVVGLDNLNNYYDPVLKQRRLQLLLKHPKFVFYLRDLTGSSPIPSGHSPDMVIHLAAQAGVRYSLEKPLAYVRDNIEATTQVFQWCADNGVGRVLYASSSSVYGNNPTPFHEEQVCDSPLNMYAASKLACERIAASYRATHGVRSIGLRFFTVYGPWGRPDMALYKFTRAMLSGDPIELYNRGGHTRNFTYVDDAVGAVMKLREKFDPIAHSGFGKVLNICNPKQVTLSEYLQALETKLGIRHQNWKPLPLQKGDIVAAAGSCARIQRLIDWEPKVSVEEGVSRFVDWYKEYYHVSS